MKTGTAGHIKTKRLKRILGLNLWGALGILAGIWDLCAEYADEGDIGRFSDEDIAAQLEWDGDAGELVSALVESGYLEEDPDCRVAVHDWFEHCPRYICRKVKQRTTHRRQATSHWINGEESSDLRVGPNSGAQTGAESGGCVKSLGAQNGGKTPIGHVLDPQIADLPDFGRPNRDVQPNPTQPNPTQPIKTSTSGVPKSGGADGGEVSADQQGSKLLRKATRRTAKPKSTSARGDVAAVIRHYKTYHPRARPGEREKKLIRERLVEGYTVADLCEAIDGNHRSAWHNGDNDNGREYHALELIMRNSSKVQGFLEVADVAAAKERERDKAPTFEKLREQMLFRCRNRPNGPDHPRNWSDQRFVQFFRSKGIEFSDGPRPDER